MFDARRCSLVDGGGRRLRRTPAAVGKACRMRLLVQAH
jgi:hypothetical protein